MGEARTSVYSIFLAFGNDADTLTVAMLLSDHLK